MPASAERDEMILRARQKASEDPIEDEDYETRQAVKVATETVAGLQVSIRISLLHEESIVGLLHSCAGCLPLRQG